MIQKTLEWFVNNWLSLLTPAVVFIAFIVASIWLRRKLFIYLERAFSQIRWEEKKVFLDTTKTPFLQWCIILGGYISIQLTPLPVHLKTFFGKIFSSVFILTFTWTIIILLERILHLYLKKINLFPANTTTVIIKGLKIAFSVVAVLIILDLWSMPVTPLMLMLFIAILITIFIARDEITNIFSGFEIARNKLIKVGNYIKLDTGEEGYILDITKTNIYVKTSDGKILLIPNSKFQRSIVTIISKSLKQATQPFRFSARLHLKELTGLKAINIQELVTILKKVDNSVIYYHTHNFIEEFQYLTPQPPNDFALWVNDALGDQVLGEKLANIDTFEFSTIGALRERIVEVIEEEIAKRQEHGIKDAPPGREFHFIKSLSAVIPTSYVAHDLREFIDILRVVSLGTLYYHILEARLRLHKGVNDFSIWIDDCLGEKALADEIAILDPYTYTLEGLRSMIINLAEKHLEKEYAFG
ncbi:MAG: mechanosensitive ion channel family protein [Syntrophorhabdales bacterium]|nr:mechanosensitive ion channel family protein [Syntrophorhabdales bacterium]